MHPALTVAISAARQAGEILVRYRDSLDKITIQQKAPKDYYSDVDLLAEKVIIEILQKSYPDHGIIAEESGFQHTDAESVWIIDPLDGTSNYLHGYPFFCVSIALQVKHRVVCGVVFDPIHQECFVASKGEGALLNDRRIRVSKRTDLTDALLGTTGFDEEMALSLAHQQVLTAASSVRKNGAAALELAYVAAGRLDGFLGAGLKPWDMAAAALIVQEAGGLVSDLTGQDYYLKHGHILAGTPKVFRSALQMLNAK